MRISDTNRQGLSVVALAMALSTAPSFVCAELTVAGMWQKVDSSSGDFLADFVAKVGFEVALIDAASV
jgi:hypothetical protein